MLKTIVRIAVFGIVFLSGITIVGQQAPVMKDTPASKDLVEKSKSYAKDKQALATAVQQAQTALNQKIADLQAQQVTQNKSLHEALLKDKKYRDTIVHIDEVQKQIADASADAQKQLLAQTGNLQSTTAIGDVEIKLLEGVVKRESDLPDNATWNIEMQQWSFPPEKK